MIPYDTHEYIQQMLQGSIVLYNDIPYTVMSVNNTRSSKHLAKLFLRKLTRGRPRGDEETDEIGVWFDDPLLDYQTLNRRLGYVNCVGRTGLFATYLSRQPIRRSTGGAQGLNRNTVGVFYPDVPRFFGPGYDDPNRWCNLETITAMDGFDEMIHGVYPTLEEAVQLQVAGRADGKVINGIAFCRNYAVFPTASGIGFELHRSRVNVGFVTKHGALNTHPWVLKELAFFKIPVKEVA